ncbi:DNA recombination protein RmuC [Sphingomonas gellani]|uniref:DNA recombination protein RmuC homolog n=1 Tax=Sphingomonas gellani TaxID=1166340 RepID=A0A1H7ZS84_9SPHN|nr:DNA recombination protein RmuC [Sphingomonas gellani]SEM61502.1 DNA recombination protein RmuC [Sphingomonas gellani]
MVELLLVAVLALAAGLLVGWLVAGRRQGALASELAVARTRAADAELVRQARDAVERERNDALQELAGLRAQAAQLGEAHVGLSEQLGVAQAELRDLAALKAQSAAREEAHQATLRQLHDAREAMNAHFGAAAAKALEGAQAQFLERAQARFTESEKLQGQRLSALLQPVNERLQRYEDGVRKVEDERRSAFGELKGQIEAMRVGQERVSGEAAKLVNALRNAPKARGRWGEQQLRNVLESCGLSEHADFQTEVSVSGEGGERLRPDAIIRVPGGKSLVIDAKVSLNAYQDAFGAVDEAERQAGLNAHAASMRAHVNGLGAKAYWNQFADAPDYVIMFVPGEHFLSAALEHDAGLWDYAFERKVLLATPTNLIAIARTVAAVWRQELLASQAREIGTLGKELYQRLCVMGGHVAKLGKNLDTAMGAYNAFVGSLESQVLTSARRFEGLNIDTGGKSLDALPVGEQAPRPLTKLTVEARDVAGIPMPAIAGGDVARSEESDG